MRLLGESKAADHLMPKNTKSKKVDDEYWPIVKEAYDLGMEVRRPFEARWILCLAFLKKLNPNLMDSTLLKRLFFIV